MGDGLIQGSDKWDFNHADFLRLVVLYIGVTLTVYTVPDSEYTLHILNMHLLKVLDIMVCISINEVL